MRQGIGTSHIARAKHPQQDLIALHLRTRTRGSMAKMRKRYPNTPAGGYGHGLAPPVTKAQMRKRRY